MRLSRRAMLGGAVSTLATGAFADAPLTSVRPRARVMTTGSGQCDQGLYRPLCD